MVSAIAQAVQRSRKQLGLSTAMLAGRARVATDDLEDLEAGKRPLSANGLVGIARAMGLPATAFLSTESAATATPPLDRAKFFHSDNAPLLSEVDVAAIMRETTRSQIFGEFAQPQLKIEDHFQPSTPGSKPWRQGYDLAASLRSKLGLGWAPIPNVAAVVEDGLGILIAKHAFLDSRLRAAAVRANRGRLIIVSKRLPVTGLRVAITHELCHHICDLSPNEALGEIDQAKLDEFASSDPGEEQRAKAFAVMFLAPAALVRDLFEQPNYQFGTAEKALEAAHGLASRCGLGEVAALWHLFHLKYLTDREDDVLNWQRYSGAATTVTGFEQSFGEQDGLLRAIDAALASGDIDEDHADRLRGL